ncbi:LysR family transcriptional regulator [Alkalimarinus alittae]|uniref:LysR family transcriptional regulator n=1 Tax=Alkalimarinus alittae TaxID=2961619 RepID=A0ABY6N2K0_9ALTE|nr:LysR family transcriptional regulator [Alkalimarinus alittae]UZE96321.1 LysR family transcriptional regulator [Alkalimarinus alittae]
MRYTLRQLEVFLATAHFENITQAAESISLSQSAASEALKGLEKQFDIQLFDRVGKRLQLNELGRLLRPKAEALIERAEDLENAFRQHKDIGALKVGATLSIGNYLAVNIMAEFMRLHPKGEVSLQVANTTTIANKISNFELDVGLVEGELHRPELEVIPWRDDELCVFCAPSHPLAKHVNLTDKDLLNAVWIMRESGSGTRQAFDWAMHGLLPELNILLELQHTEAIKRAVETGLGIGCLSNITLEDAFERGSLVRLDVPHRNFHRRFYFILHKDKYRSAGIESWLELCRSS